jgi:hypothetical protein
MSIKRFFLLTTALYVSQHNEQLSAMDTLPPEVLNLILYWLPLESQPNFVQTNKRHTCLHEINIPTHCSGCTINTENIKTNYLLKNICARIKNISIVGSFTIKGKKDYAPIFNNFSNQKSISDLQLFDCDISSSITPYIITYLASRNAIKSLMIGKEKPQGERVYINVDAMTSLLKSMPHLEQCVLSHVTLHCNDDDDACVQFERLGAQLFKLKSVAISNSSVGYYDSLHWLLIALRESKSIKELTLNNIYTTQINIPFEEEDNYINPVILTREKQLSLKSACICSTIQCLTLDNKIVYDVRNS